MVYQSGVGGTWKNFGRCVPPPNDKPTLLYDGYNQNYTHAYGICHEKKLFSQISSLWRSIYIISPVGSDNLQNGQTTFCKSSGLKVQNFDIPNNISNFQHFWSRNGREICIPRKQHVTKNRSSASYIHSKETHPITYKNSYIGIFNLSDWLVVIMWLLSNLFIRPTLLKEWYSPGMWPPPSMNLDCSMYTTTPRQK